MKIVKIDLEKDYDKLTEIWDKRSFPHVSRKILSNYGYAIQNDGAYVSFCFLYLAQGSKLCWIGFPTTNPSYDKETRASSLDDLLLTIMKIAKEMNYDTIMTSTGTTQIKERLDKMNFQITDENVSLYFRSI
jgi:hypothetical protein